MLGQKGKLFFGAIVALLVAIGLVPAQANFQAQSTPPIPTQDLEVHLDASQGSYTSTWSDLSGNGNDLTMTSGTSDAGSWFSFDGTGHGEFADLELVNPSAYTKVLWFRTNDLSVRNNLFSAGSSTNGHYLWGGGEGEAPDPCTASGDRLGAANEAVSSYYSRIVASECTPLNTWLQVAVSFDSTSGWKMFINGQLDATDPDTTTFSYPLTSNVNTQIAAYGGRNKLKGDIAQVYLYNRALSQSEVTQLFTATKDAFGYINYTVTFNSQGGINPDPVTGVVNRDSLILPSVTRPLKTLTGWFDQAVGGSKIGDPGDSYSPTAASENLFAQWADDSTLQLHLDAAQASYGSSWTNLVSGPTVTMTGASDQGSYFSFDGVNDYGEVNQLDFVNPAGYTKLLWFRLGSDSTVNNLLSSNNTASHAFWAFGDLDTVNCPSRNLAAGNNPGSGTWHQVRSNNCLDLNQWYQAAVTFDETVGWELYLNGQLDATSNTTNKITGTGFRTYLGRYGSGYWLNGDIAQVYVWNRAVDGTEIESLFEQTRADFGYTDYTVSFDAQGGSATSAVATGIAFRDETLLPNASRGNDRFEGWFTQSTGGTRVGGSGDAYTPAPNTTTETLFAQWTPGYQLTLDPQNGAAPTSSVYVSGDPALTLPTVSNGVDRFEGWFDSATGGNKVGNAGDSVSPGADTTLFAQWTPGYQITFDSQGGSAASSLIHISGDTDPLLPTVTRNNYTFDGWYTTSVGGTRVGGPGDAFTPTATTTLFARWTPIPLTFTVNFDAGLGSVTPSSLSYTQGGAALTLPTPSRDDYVFQGWFDAPTLGNKIGDAGDPYTPVASATLHARWIQASLAGIDPADLILAGSIVKVQGVGNSNIFTTSAGQVTVTVPADALPAGTTVTIYALSNNNYAQGILSNASDFLLSLVVAWKAADETVPVATEPITVKIENQAIQIGAEVYGILNGQSQLLATASVAGEVTVSFTTDPVITIANNVAPTTVVVPPSNSTPPTTQPPATDPELVTPPAVDLGDIQTEAAIPSRIKAIGEMQAKMYTFDLVGKGKVQLFLNGKEIAWVRAETEDDPKLRRIGDRSYFVRTVDLEEGIKNVLEVYLNGERIQRVAHSR